MKPLARTRGADGGALGEEFELLEVHHRVFHAEDVVEAAPRKAAEERHLAAFEARLAGEAAAALLALFTAAGRFAEARARAAAHTLAVFGGARIGSEIAETGGP
jgi:hypothetical protein